MHRHLCGSSLIWFHGVTHSQVWLLRLRWLRDRDPSKSHGRKPNGCLLDMSRVCVIVNIAGSSGRPLENSARTERNWVRGRKGRGSSLLGRSRLTSSQRCKEKKISSSWRSKGLCSQGTLYRRFRLRLVGDQKNLFFFHIGLLRWGSLHSNAETQGKWKL